jgi:hypothetical protein
MSRAEAPGEAFDGAGVGGAQTTLVVRLGNLPSDGERFLWWVGARVVGKKGWVECRWVTTVVGGPEKSAHPPLPSSPSMASG